MRAHSLTEGIKTLDIDETYTLPLAFIFCVAQERHGVGSVHDIVAILSSPRHVERYNHENV